MTHHRFVISDRLWQLIAPLLPGKATDRSPTALDNRPFLEAVFQRVGTRPLAESTPWVWQMEQPAPPLPAVVKQQGVAAVVPGPQWPSQSGICAHRGHSHWLPPASEADPPQQRSNAMDHQRTFWCPAGGQSIGHRLAAHRVGCLWGNNQASRQGPATTRGLLQGSLKWCP